MSHKYGQSEYSAVYDQVMIKKDRTLKSTMLEILTL